LETLKIMIEASKHIQSVYINNVWTTMGAFLVAFGWLLTSAEARKYIKEHRSLLSYSKTIVVSLFIIHAVVLGKSWCDSYLLITEMEKVAKLIDPPPNDILITLYEIPWYWPVSSLIINGFIATLLLKKLQLLKGLKET